MIELVKQTFWSLVQCAIYKAIWDPLLKIILYRFRTFMCTKAVLLSNYKKSNYDFCPLHSHILDQLKTKLNWQNISKYPINPFSFLSFPSFPICKYPLPFQGQNLILKTNLSLSLIEEFEFRFIHSLWLRYLSLKRYLYTLNERMCPW